MNSKTPQFDKALDEIFISLIPHERMCKKCAGKFRIESEDIDFLRMLRVPPPTLCPGCREKRRYGYLLRMPRFFKKKCEAPGHTEEVVTLFPPDSPNVIYDVLYWYSDAWDSTLYGIDFNFSGSFFSQFKKLFLSVPHLAVDRDLTATNCDYTVGGKWAKNNYYCGGGYKSEDCMYSPNPRFSKYCVDCTDIWNSEFCFASVNVERSSRCIFIVDSANCLDSAFLYDCRNCSNCFLSSNLRNRSYVFQNEQLSREEYRKKVRGIHLGEREVFGVYKGLFDEIFEKSVHRAVTNTNIVNSVGDRLTDCKNCFNTFDGSVGENLRYVHSFNLIRDSMDILFAAENAEKCYECGIAVGSYLKFSLYMRSSMEMEYCSDCQNCKNCFGCVGLRNKSFHIFNKPYSEEKYWETVDKIKLKMLENGEYGEFFDLSLGLIPYQSTNGQYYFPLSEESAREQDIPWYPEPEPNMPTGMEFISGNSRFLGDIRGVPDDIIQKAILSEKTNRPFRVLSQEMSFYRKMNVPFPAEHPWERILSRKKYQHRMELSDFTCPKCGEKSFSIYTPEEQEKLKVFCEKCYLREVV